MVRTEGIIATKDHNIIFSESKINIFCDPFEIQCEFYPDSPLDMKWGLKDPISGEISEWKKAGELIEFAQGVRITIVDSNCRIHFEKTDAELANIGWRRLNYQPPPSFVDPVPRNPCY